MRNRFDQQLELLNEQLIRMGELCEVAIGKATTALKEGSMEQAQKVIEADEEIDQAETDIERLCLKLLLQQQPVARDFIVYGYIMKDGTILNTSGSRLGKMDKGFVVDKIEIQGQGSDECQFLCALAHVVLCLEHLLDLLLL